MAHQQYHAAHVFDTVGAFLRRVQNLQLHVPEQKAVAGASNLHWYVMLGDRLQRERHARDFLVGERWRTSNPIYGESFEQRRQAVEVIEIGVGKKDRIDPAD